MREGKATRDEAETFFLGALKEASCRSRVLKHYRLGDGVRVTPEEVAERELGGGTDMHSYGIRLRRELEASEGIDSLRGTRSVLDITVARGEGEAIDLLSPRSLKGVATVTVTDGEHSEFDPLYRETLYLWQNRGDRIEGDASFVSRLYKEIHK